MDECTICDGTTEVVDKGMYKGYMWYHTKCKECGHEESTEPDYDSMPGGHDDY